MNTMPGRDDARHAAGEARRAAADAGRLADRAGEAESREARAAGAHIQQNPAYRAFVTVGLLAYGVVHLLIAWTALQIAWGGGSGSASSTGALQGLAGNPFGLVALVACAAGLFVLVIWQVIEAAIGHTHVTGRRRLIKRLASAGKSVVYAALGVTAVRVALGAGGGGEQQQESLVATAMASPGGRIAVIAVGVGIVIVGIVQIVSGLRRSFRDDLDGGVPGWALAMGTIGFAAKGVALGIVGFLFAWAGIRHNPEAAGNTNSALRSLMEQPFGPYLLTAMAIGIALFGLFCFVWSRNANHEQA